MDLAVNVSGIHWFLFACLYSFKELLCLVAWYVFGRRMNRDVFDYALDVAVEAEEVYAVTATTNVGVHYDFGRRFAGGLGVSIGVA